MAQLKTPSAQVSKTVQRLLAQIHAEAEAATLQALSAKDGIVVLFDVDPETRRVEARGDHLEVRDARGTDFHARRYRTLPDEWKNCPEIHHPSWWHAYECRVDGQGVSWYRETQVMVTDDFGNLVDIEGGAA